MDTSLKEADNGTMISGINLSFSSSIWINITVDPSTGILKLLQVLDVVNKGGYTFMLALPKEIHVTDVTYVLEVAQKKFLFSRVHLRMQYSQLLARAGDQELDATTPNRLNSTNFTKGHPD